MKLIERLRSVKWEAVEDWDRMPDDPMQKCVFVDMRPDDFRALLREAADALEAMRAEVAEWKRVAAAQAELHGEAEERAERLEKILRSYQKAVNKIDDLVEYALPMPRETKGALYSVLADLTEELVKESKA